MAVSVLPEAALAAADSPRLAAVRAATAPLATCLVSSAAGCCSRIQAGAVGRARTMSGQQQRARKGLGVRAG